MNVVVDTSVFIDFARAKVGIFDKLINLYMKETIELYIPTIVITEFWAGDDMKIKRNIKNAEKLFFHLKRQDLNEEIAKLAGELIRNKLVTGFDSIIAATALYLNAQVATKNNKHFLKVKGIKLFSAR